ncbi:MAG TPA: hypothetical protein VGQ73_02345 [Gemmatimonadales bacterium]|jgi:hypothetical protein|nr:hypothetical protein [Gemmatimonadales bacterium]
MSETEKAELIHMLNESHERFIEGLVNDDGQLAMLAYSNYVRALGTLLEDLTAGAS